MGSSTDEHSSITLPASILTNAPSDRSYTTVLNSAAKCARVFSIMPCTGRSIPLNDGGGRNFRARLRA